MKKVFIATRLEASTHDALKALAERQDRTVAWLVRKAVEQYVEQHKADRKARAAA
jgi:predicted DNA-binding protein